MPRGGARPNAGRPSHWNDSNTILIRVPKRFAQQCLTLARLLDNGESIRIVKQSNKISPIRGKQLNLLDVERSDDKPSL